MPSVAETDWDRARRRSRRALLGERDAREAEAAQLGRERDRLASENDALHDLVYALAERVAGQAEILSRRAERKRAT